MAKEGTVIGVAKHMGFVVFCFLVAQVFATCSCVVYVNAVCAGGFNRVKPTIIELAPGIASPMGSFPPASFHHPAPPGAPAPRLGLVKVTPKTQGDEPVARLWHGGPLAQGWP